MAKSRILQMKTAINRFITKAKGARKNTVMDTQTVSQEQSATTEEPQRTSEPAEMSFLEHLEELRRRLFYALGGIAVGSVIAGIFINFIIEDLLLRPALAAHLKLQNFRPFGQPFLYFKVIFIAGIIIAFPFVLYQLWKFIAPGLYEHERRWVRSVTTATSFCFFAGVAFAYFVLLPGMMNFAASFGTEKIANIIDINEYFGFVTLLILASGIIFELPVVSFILARIGLLTSEFMRRYRRHSIVAILILAAVLTPTPDPINQVIFAIPLFALYELSIWIVRLIERRNAIGAVAQQTTQQSETDTPS